ncbi:hypothetical protein [Psychrobacillus sp. NPDC096623]|uniref:hypothetical protein n=1 Tax=Psychrobacillus sp. NPDC096623 TaxID=3364492 RepID=UPI00380E7000
MNQLIKRLGSYTSVISGILLIVAHSLNIGADPNGSTIGSSLVFAAHLLLVFAFFGLYSHGNPNKLLGFVAMILGIIGNIIVTAIVYVEIALASGEEVEMVFSTSVTEPIYTFGPLLFVLGMFLLGISIIREKVLPSISGYLFLLGNIVFAGASFLGNGQEIIELIGSILTGAGFITAGLKLKRE